MSITGIILAAAIVGGTGLFIGCVPWYCRKEICSRSR